MSTIKFGSVQIGTSQTASNNFHWRNLLDGLLRLSRGNAGAPITDVMTVNADNSVSFPGGIVGGFTKEYVSAEQVITAGSVITLTHGLGVMPKQVQVTLMCKSAEHGYSVGDETEALRDSTANSYGIQSGRNSTSIRAITSSAGIAVTNAAGNYIAATPANWRLIVRAWA